MQYTKFILVVGFSVTFPALSAASDSRGPGGEWHAPPPFIELDLDANGVVTLEEFRRHEIPHGEHAELFSRIDANADGQLTKEEFASHEPPRPPHR
ncbi:MAG TPA: hypothetical protein EYP19_06685 [Desulfobacterales bacterium]|nr:hypothetical protein [Desulfobacterales bacterium]